MSTDRLALYHAANAADDAWHAELTRLFGDNAGDVRYTERGRTGPTLAPLYAAYRAAADALFPDPPADKGLTAAERAHGIDGL